MDSDEQKQGKPIGALEVTAGAASAFTAGSLFARAHTRAADAKLKSAIEKLVHSGAVESSIRENLGSDVIREGISQLAKGQSPRALTAKILESAQTTITKDPAVAAAIKEMEASNQFWKGHL